MLSLQNAKWSRNGVLVVRCAMIILLCSALLMISSISTTNVGAQDQSATTKFRRVGKPIPNQYIVVLDDNIPGDEVAPLAFNLASGRRGILTATYAFALKGFSIHEISEAAAIAISNDPRVEFVEENAMGTTGTVEAIPTPSDSVPSPWQLDRIDQTGTLSQIPLDNSYTYNQTGSGVHAYVLDTGIRTTHVEMGGRAINAVDFIGGNPPGEDCTSASPSNSGHGTPVAGVIGATTHGVAKSVTMYSVRVCNCALDCPSDTVIQGIDWVTGQHVKPAVANMSIYIRGGSNALDKAVRKSIASGVTYVVSAGNGDQNQIGENASTVSPARVTQAITVGATGIDASYPVSDARASFSNFGDVLDLFAPGQRTASPAAIDPSNPINNVAIYGRFGGTSAAAPAVAGVAALYLQTDTKACPCTVSNVIKQKANTGVVTNAGSGSPPDMLHLPSSWDAPSYRSLSLNGTTAYVEVPTAAGPNGVKLDITGFITVEAWIRLNSVGSARPIVERYSYSDGGYSLDITSGGKVQFYTLTTASTFDSVTGSTTLLPNVWYHVAGVWGGLTLRVYVNGNLDAPAKSSTFAPGTGASSLLIGRSVDGTHYFGGLIDEVRVTGTWLYNSNFTPQNRVTGTVETKGLWRFDYQTAQDCADMNNGTLMGGASFSTSVP